jgi:hypothetical protein
VLHVQIGTSAALGSVWDWDAVSRRLGYSYVVDWGDMAADFLTFGAATRVWDTNRKATSFEKFGYFNVADFDPEHWKNEYSNPAFSRMTERDAAWMARILARFTPEMVQTLAEMGRLADPADTEYLRTVLDGRLSKILERYLTRLSPIASVHVEGGDLVCGTDLAEARRLRPPESFLYAARLVPGGWLPLVRRPNAEVCVRLAHVAPDAGPADGAPERYVRVRIEDGVAARPLVVHLYDLGQARGYVLAGLERP